MVLEEETRQEEIAADLLSAVVACLVYWIRDVSMVNAR